MKFIKKIFMTIVVTFLFTGYAYAASGSVTVSTGTKTAVVGSTFNVTVKVSCTDTIGSWQYGLVYNSSVISLVSGDTNVAGFGDGNIKSKTYTYKFKAIKAGKANINISSPSMVSWNDDANLFTPSINSTNITVKTQAEIEASYSKDNTLKSLSVEGYELNPVFNKDTTEYTVNVPDTTTEIKVSAVKNDANAHVSGAGKISLSEGINKVEITVTAQNGAVKTYKINVDVHDLQPIEVNIDSKKYSVIKKAELLTGPVGFTPATLKINDIDVPGFTSELAGLTVVGLKDEQGNISMFTYDSSSGEYKKYIELKGTSITLCPKPIEEVLDDFEKTTLKINEQEYEVLKSTKLKDFYLVYGMNIETGKTSYYIYNLEEHSFQKYNEEDFQETTKENFDLKLYLSASVGICSIMTLLTISFAIKNAKMKKIVIRISAKANNSECKSDEKEDIG